MDISQLEKATPEEIKREQESTRKLLDAMHAMCKANGGAVRITPAMIGELLRKADDTH